MYLWFQTPDGQQRTFTAPNSSMFPNFVNFISLRIPTRRFFEGVVWAFARVPDREGTSEKAAPPGLRSACCQ
jgi:hypothetical protein